MAQCHSSLTVTEDSVKLVARLDYRKCLDSTMDLSHALLLLFSHIRSYPLEISTIVDLNEKIQDLFQRSI